MEKKRLVKKAQREFIEKIRGFEKRSKFITIKYINNLWGRCIMQINISKENKIVDEMIEYIKNLCSYIEENGNSVWFSNYDRYAEDNPDEWALEYEICVHKSM